MKRWLVMLIAAILVAGPLSACSTMEGLGKDVEATGETLQDWAGEDEESGDTEAGESADADAQEL